MDTYIIKLKNKKKNFSISKPTISIQHTEFKAIHQDGGATIAVENCFVHCLSRNELTNQFIEDKDTSD